MTDKVSRREFLKITTLGAAAAAVLTGCGPASRYVKRQPYSDMPEYTVTGKSTFFATTCGECPAGCGLIVRTMEGRAIKVDGNPNHPVNHGKTCQRGQAALQGLYNPDRTIGPGKRAQRGGDQIQKMDWDAAVGVVADALKNNQPGEIAFLTGLFPDHLADLIELISAGLGGAQVLRYSTLSEMDGRATLMQASQNVLGAAQLPFFDIEHADLIFSFGANFLETWLSPVAYTSAYGWMRQGRSEERGYLVHFEARMSQTAANADEWIPINPGTEALVALALGRLVAEAKLGSAPAAFVQVDVADVAAKSGVKETDLRRLVAKIMDATATVVIPGGVPLGYTNGLETAQAILSLNILVDNLGKAGGVFLTPASPLYPGQAGKVNTAAQMGKLIDQMNAGQIKALFVHGVNPVYDLPKIYGFEQALQKVSQVFSFASYPDETALQSDYVFPDHTPAESWGYQKILTGSDRMTVSGLQPVVVPLYNTRSTVDVLLAAVKAVGGKAAESAPFSDEVDFIEKSIAVLMDQGGFYTAPTPQAFTMLWQQYGGWWKEQAGLVGPKASFAFDKALPSAEAQIDGSEPEYKMLLLTCTSINLGDGSHANRPTLQETPDPMTTVMWNTWIEINPKTALELGVKSDDVVKVTSPAGEVEAVVYEYPAIHPGMVAMPLGQGHTAFGRYAQGRGVRPLDLLGKLQNGAGNLSFMSVRVKITPTGKRRLLARYESREGIYGNKGNSG